MSGLVTLSDDSCVYCCERPGVTRDHVPAKQLFPVPRPANLLTVPCCGLCNQRFQPHEDYFRALICLGSTGETPVARRIWEQKVERGLQRDRGLRRVLTAALRRIPAITEAGLYLGHRDAYRVDWPRLHLVVRKWTRALYVEEYGQALPPNAQIHTRLIHGPLVQTRDVLHQLSLDAKHAWPGVFEYRHNREAERLDRSMWTFTVLGSVEFLAVTSVPEKAR
ncbi:uncharacterized protein SOCE836_076800 [Sorangium cellulosum]|uniref:HNH endonuclease n=1 Tax=Sorangium cellulosum TaxID=56 RepID=A0A4P2QY33_SORCE|nr:uncharacterized protein SOCE836_076800 [Sorangium cellulosum]